MKYSTLFIAGTLLIACGPSSQDQTQAQATRVGMNNPRCITAAGGEAGDDVSFCTDGRRLIVCVDGDECLTVNLDPEMPAPGALQ